MKPTESNPFSDYRYECTDRSVLLPFYKKYAAVFLPAVPYRLTANLITLSGFFLIMFAALTSAGLFPFLTRTPTVLILLGCVHLYMLFDHLDGMQAKRTGTGSPLGEFLDHYLDLLNTPLIILAVYGIMDGLHPGVAAFGVFGGMIAAVGTFYGQYRFRLLDFGRCNSVEALVLIQLYLVGSLFDEFREFAAAPLYAGITINTGLIFLVGASSLVSGMMYLIKAVRAGTDGPHLTVFMILYVYVSVATFPGELTLPYTAGLVIPPAIFAGELIEHYLSKAAIKRPTAIIAALLTYLHFFFAAFKPPQLLADVTGDPFVSILLGLLLYAFARAFVKMKMFWLWRNPAP